MAAGVARPVAANNSPVRPTRKAGCPVFPARIVQLRDDWRADFSEQRSSWSARTLRFIEVVRAQGVGMTDTIVSSGTTSTLLVGDGDSVYVQSDGTLVDTSIFGGSVGATGEVQSGGKALDTTVSGDPTNGSTYLQIDSGGYASGTTLLNGGNEDDEGKSLDAIVSSGGQQDATLGGVASG